MSDNILLSVVIPMYNSEEYIGSLLESYVQNKYNRENIELIIVDDGSNDLSVSIATNYIRNNNINGRVISSQHQGASVARNLGIKESHGDYILFCDSDDLLVNNIINLVQEAVKNNIDVISIESDVLISHDKMILNKPYDNLRIAFSMFGGQNYGISSNEFGMGPVRKLYKRQIIKDNNITFPIGVTTWEDGIFNLHFLIHSRKIELVKKNMYSVRNNPKSTSRKIDSTICTNAQKIMAISNKMLLDIDLGFRKKILSQERVYILWELFGKYFIWHPNYKQYRQLFTHSSLKDLVRYGVNLQSRLLVVSLRYLGFYPSVFWYKYLKLLKNKLTKQQKWY